MQKEKSNPVKKEVVNVKTTTDFAFGKINYTLMIAGIVILLFGYWLMSGGGSKDPKVFNPEVFSFAHITLAPIVIIIGYAVEILAIVIKAKD